MSKLGLTLGLGLAGVVLAGAGLSAYARLAPSDATVWHRLPKSVQAGDYAGAAQRILPDTAAFSQLDEIARATPRTTVLAGSVEEGLVTYITRTRLMGFPDYTTIGVQDGALVLFARLRFGKYDMGVNARRLDNWLARLTR